MRLLHIRILVCLVLGVLWIPSVAGLQCPSCTYISTSADIPDIVKTVIETVLGLFQDKECAQTLTGPIPEIKEETCTAVSGQVPRCTSYSGSVTLTISVLVTTVEVPMNIFQRGCDHFKTANVPSSGCHRADAINEDKTLVQQFLSKVSSTLEDYRVANFQGEICICTDTYCKETSGVSKNAVMNMLLVFLSSLIVLLL